MAVEHDNSGGNGMGDAVFPERMAHLAPNLRACGVNTQPAIDAMVDTYDETIRRLTPSVVGPGEIEDIEAALILPQSNSARPETTYAAIVLTYIDEPFVQRPQIDKPILMVSQLDGNACFDTHDDRKAALASTFRNWRNGLGSGPFSPMIQKFSCPLVSVAREAHGIVQGNCDFLENRLHSTLDTLSVDHDGDIVDDFPEIKNTREAIQERRRLADATSAFRQYLDPDITRLARDTGMLTVGFYNALAGHGNPQRARYRQQAVRAYPLIAPELARKSVILSNIDAGWSLPKSVISDWLLTAPDKVKDWGTSKRSHDTLRQLQGRTWQDTDQRILRTRDLGPAVSEMMNVPVDWIPSSRSDFQAMRRTCKIAENVSMATHHTLAHLLKSTGGHWQPFLGRTETYHQGNVTDMLSRAFDHLVLPEVLRQADNAGYDAVTFWNSMSEEDLREPTSRAVLGDHGLLKILRANDRFHRRLPRLDALTRTYENSGIAWPAVGPELTFDNLTIVPLTTPEALKEDGDAMEHCVGGYTEQCLNGSHIVSVRDGNYRLGTARLDEQDNDTRRYLELNERRGPRNTIPIEPVETALQKYVQYLNTPGNEPNFTEMDRVRATANDDLMEQRIMLRLGFDHHDRDVQEAVWQEWRSIIPGPGRKAETYTCFLQQTGLDCAIGQVIRDHIDPSVSKPETEAVQPGM